MRKHAPALFAAKAEAGEDTKTNEGRAEVFKQLGRQWREEPDARKQKYQRLAERINDAEGRGAKA